MRFALTREVSPAIASCELTHLERLPIDIELARQQHRLYEQALEACGCQVRRLPAAPELPDSVFVEDTAVVVDEVAVITRPGAVSRRPETAAMSDTLAAYRPIVHIADPGILDGGDVLRLGDRFFVGLSSRSNNAGLEQLRRALAPFGYAVEGVAVGGCLHLKSAVTALADDAVLLNPDWVNPSLFGARTIIAVDSEEPGAANALRIGDRVIYPSEFPLTMQRLVNHGYDVLPVPASEVAKAEGAVTCCSVVLLDKEPSLLQEPKSVSSPEPS